MDRQPDGNLPLPPPSAPTPVGGQQNATANPTITIPNRPPSTTSSAEESMQKLKRQIMASQVAAAQQASPMSNNILNILPIPLSGNESMDTLSQMLRLLQENPQPGLDAKVIGAYKRSVPHNFPLGIDLHALAQEKERLLRERAKDRIAQLESTIAKGELSHSESIRCQIELKSLKLSNFQRQTRQNLLRVVHQLRSTDNLVDRSTLRRNKKQSLREARLTKRLEQQQRKERSKQRQKSHVEFLQTVTNHLKELQLKWRNASQKRGRLIKLIMHHHNNVEKEESRRMDKVAKDRLKALKADDEEAYLKLLDQQKDTRLTYLLKQTDEFLSGLVSKVTAQQQETAIKMEMNSGGAYLRPAQESLVDDEEVNTGDYFSIAHRVKEAVEEQPRMLVGGRLKDYQVRGLQWLVSLYNNHLNGILADEMGLGKTVQAISLISYLIEKKNQTGPYLVIVPLSTMTNWVMEFERWAPSVVKVEYKGVPSQRKLLQNQLKHGKFNVLLTTYEYVIKDKPFLSKIKWLYLIMDEGHRMKNARSKLAIVLNQYYQMRFRVILTGTPLQNNLPELWSLLNFLLPKIFNSCKTFEEWFNAPFANTGEKVELNEEELLLIIRRLHKVLRPFLLRRLKKDVESELPDKVEMILKCPMSALQQTLYNMVTKRSANAFRDPKSFGIRRLNNTIMQLRKICNHPFVFPEVESQMNPRHINNELLYRSAGKFELLQRVLPKLNASGHKVKNSRCETNILIPWALPLACCVFRF